MVIYNIKGMIGGNYFEELVELLITSGYWLEDRKTAIEILQNRYPSKKIIIMEVVKE